MAVHSQPFKSPRAKVARARHLTAELKSEVDGYLRGVPFYQVLLRDRETRAYVLSAVRRRAPLPDSLSSIFGDAIHNLRSALDILANDLVTLSGIQPNKVYFPFAQSAEGLDEQIKNKMPGITPDLAEMVRGLKPYKGGNVLLRALHDLDIFDKHVDFIEAGYSISTQLPLVSKPSTTPGIVADVVADVSRLPTKPIADLTFGGWGTYPANFEVIGEILGSSTVLTIGPEMPLNGRDPIATLNELADLVQGIIETFESHCLGRQKPGI